MARRRCLTSTRRRNLGHGSDTWRAIPRERVGDLTRNPVRRWAVRHGNMDELSAVEPNDDEAIEQVECERREDGPCLNGLLPNGKAQTADFTRSERYQA